MRVARILGCLAALAILLQPAQAAVHESQPATCSNEMGFDLVRRLDPHGTANVFISPYSISSALVVTANGAKGATQDGMRKALHMSEISLSDANGVYLKLNTTFNKAPAGIRLSVANGLFVKTGYVLQKPFLEMATSKFGASVDQVNFADAGAVPFINKWVTTKTSGKIKELIKDLPGSTRLVIANAVYFKAPWEEAFESYATRPGPFHVTAGSTIQLPMMNQEKYHRYSKVGALEALVLPYKDSSYEMVLLLPAPKSSLDEALKSINTSVWNKLMDAGSQEKKVSLKLPKFKIQYSSSLKGSLMAMGMEQACGPTADFRGITESEPLFIGDVLHKTFLDVNEKGTEAAAATAIVMLAGGMPVPEPTIPFVVDRPFIVAIQDRDSKTILFLGVIRDPRK